MTLNGEDVSMRCHSVLLERDGERARGVYLWYDGIFPVLHPHRKTGGLHYYEGVITFSLRRRRTHPDHGAGPWYMDAIETDLAERRQPAFESISWDIDEARDVTTFR